MIVASGAARPAEAARMTIEDAGGPALGCVGRVARMAFRRKTGLLDAIHAATAALISAILAPGEQATMPMGRSPPTQRATL